MGETLPQLVSSTLQNRYIFYKIVLRTIKSSTLDHEHVFLACEGRPIEHLITNWRVYEATNSSRRRGKRPKAKAQGIMFNSLLRLRYSRPFLFDP